VERHGKRDSGDKGEEEKDGVGVDGETKHEKSTPQLVVKLHWGFQAAGLIASLTHTMWSVLYTVTMDETFDYMQTIMLPFTLLIFGVTFFGDPKSGEKRFEVILVLCFAAAEVTVFVRNAIVGSATGAIISVVRGIVWWCLVYLGFKLRAIVSALQDEDLSNCLLNSALNNATQSISGMLFVTFKALNCAMETRSLESCRDKLLCSMFLNVFLSLFVTVKMIIGAMSERQKGSKRSLGRKLP